MAALKEIAREYADEIRDGIGWLIVYRTGRSWHALTVWSDLGNNEWETDDILHAKRARVRKKYRNRIRRAFFAALASEGGGSS